MADVEMATDWCETVGTVKPCLVQFRNKHETVQLIQGPVEDTFTVDLAVALMQMNIVKDGEEALKEVQASIPRNLQPNDWKQPEKMYTFTNRHQLEDSIRDGGRKDGMPIKIERYPYGKYSNDETKNAM